MITVAAVTVVVEADTAVEEAMAAVGMVEVEDMVGAEAMVEGGVEETA